MSRRRGIEKEEEREGGGGTDHVRQIELDLVLEDSLQFGALVRFLLRRSVLELLELLPMVV